ncbi:MAG: helix-turn-helix domain-containing protein [Planctomycetota bacterium]|nr:helix-turn-helix domain-containing protein [Planctomycetota bacterium]
MMQKNGNATAGVNTGGERMPRETPAMLDIQAVADLLGCSIRHVYRLSDAGLMPRPVKLGALVRWSRAAILDWIDKGCPPCRREAR